MPEALRYDNYLFDAEVVPSTSKMHSEQPEFIGQSLVTYSFANSSSAVSTLLGEVVLKKKKDVFSPFFKKLTSLEDYEDGWDSYSAPQPSVQAIENAKSILTSLENIDFSPMKIIPSCEGGVAIVFKNRHKYADFECFNDGEILMAMASTDGEPFVREISLEDLDEGISETHAFFSRSA